MRASQEGIPRGCDTSCLVMSRVTLGEPMRRSVYALFAACLLVALPVNAQEGQEKQPLVPRRPLFKLEKQNTPPTVIEALKSLGAITVGDIRSMSDGDLRQ